MDVNTIQKKTLALIWACHMNGVDPARRMSEFLEPDEIRARVDGLVDAGMLNEDLHVTEEGRRSIEVVMFGGVFDVIHHGHTYALNAAKQLGDVLVVVVASDHTIKNTNRIIHHDACTRHRIVGSIGVVDICLVGHETDIFASVRDVSPDVIALGYDQVHRTAHIEAGCRRMGLSTRVVRLDSPVPNVTSSELKKNITLDMM